MKKKKSGGEEKKSKITKIMKNKNYCKNKILRFPIFSFLILY